MEDRDEKRPLPAERAFRYAQIAQASVLTVAAALGVAAARPIVAAQQTRAELAHAEAQAELSKRAAQARNVLEMALDAQPLGVLGGVHYVSLAVELRNQGNRTLRLPARELRARLGRVSGVDAEGRVRIENERALDLLGDGAETLVIEPGEALTLTALATTAAVGAHVLGIAASAEDAAGYEFVSRKYFWVA